MRYLYKYKKCQQKLIQIKFGKIIWKIGNWLKYYYNEYLYIIKIVIFIIVFIMIYLCFTLICVVSSQFASNSDTLSRLYLLALILHPTGIANAFLGGAIGLMLVIFWECVKRPRIYFKDFIKKDDFNYKETKYLYKIRIGISGIEYPGLSEFKIVWKYGSVKAKWDEKPNPLEGDNSDIFLPELVPQTMQNFIVEKKVYEIPIIHEDSYGTKTVFSGWWFGRDKGYGIDVPIVCNNCVLEFEFISEKIKKKWACKVKDILDNAKLERTTKQKFFFS